MKNDINDIKEILQEESQQVKSDKELYNNLVKYLYNIFDSEIREDLLERGFIYFSYNDTRKDVCNELADTQEEYNYYFMNYEKALKQVKNFFKEDIKRINNEKCKCIKCENTININDNYCYICGFNQNTKIREKEKKEKKKHTIFGVNPILAMFMIPIVIFFDILDSTK